MSKTRTKKLPPLFSSIEIKMNSHPEDPNCYICLMDGQTMHSAAVVRLDYIDELVGHLLAARAFLKERCGETTVSPGTDDLVFGDERWKADKLSRKMVN